MLFFCRHKKREKIWTNCLSYKILRLGKNCSVVEWLKVKFKENSLSGLPFSLESSLQTRADEKKNFVLAISGNNYKDMLMSWVCRLRHLSVNNFVIATIDLIFMIFPFYRYQNSKISGSFICRRELGFLQNMNFSFLLSSQGLPVFRDPLAPPEIGLKSCHFGLNVFKG